MSSNFLQSFILIEHLRCFWNNYCFEKCNQVITFWFPSSGSGVVQLLTNLKFSNMNNLQEIKFSNYCAFMDEQKLKKSFTVLWSLLTNIKIKRLKIKLVTKKFINVNLKLSSSLITFIFLLNMRWISTLLGLFGSRSCFRCFGGFLSDLCFSLLIPPVRLRCSTRAIPDQTELDRALGINCYHSAESGCNTYSMRSLIGTPYRVWLVSSGHCLRSGKSDHYAPSV